FKTNDPLRKVQTVSIKGTARWSIAVSKERLYVSASKGKEATVSVDVFSPTGARFEITKLEASQSWIAVPSFKKLDQFYRVEIPIRPPALGHFSEKVIIHTNDVLRPAITIPLDISAGQTNTFSPNRFLLPSQRPGAVV